MSTTKAKPKPKYLELESAQLNQCIEYNHICSLWICWDDKEKVYEINLN